MLREVLARFGIDVDNSQILTGINSLRDFASSAFQAARAIGTALLGTLRELTTEMAEFGDETAKTARSLGIAANDLLRWRFAAERSGVPAAQLSNGLRRLQRNIVDAGEGVDTAVRAFTDLGVAFRDTDGQFREIEDILPEIADGFAALESDTQRSARAQQLFGRAGTQLLPFFADGSEGLEELSRRFDELTGGGFGGFFETAEEAQDAMADFELATTAVKASLASELLPIMTTVVTSIADFVGFINNATRGTRPFRAAVLLVGSAIGSLAAVIGFTLLPVLIIPLAIFAAWAAALGIIVLVVDDLLTLFSGGDSIIGRFLDSMFGIGTAAEVAKTLQIAWADFVAFLVDEGVPLVQRFGRFLVGLWPMIRPGLRSLGRFLVQTFNFLRGLPSQVRSFLAPIGTFFDALAARVSQFFSGIANRFASLRDEAAGVLGFFGIEVGGSAAPAGARAGAGAAVRPEGAKTTNVDQQISITIPGTNLSPDELQRRVRDAMTDANQRALRVAERALTTVVPTPAGG